jgi:hypothetical protein
MTANSVVRPAVPGRASEGRRAWTLRRARARGRETGAPSQRRGRDATRGHAVALARMAEKEELRRTPALRRGRDGTRRHSVALARVAEKHRASSIEHRASSIEHRASSIEHRASSIEHRASSSSSRSSSSSCSAVSSGAWRPLRHPLPLRERGDGVRAGLGGGSVFALARAGVPRRRGGRSGRSRALRRRARRRP